MKIIRLADNPFEDEPHQGEESPEHAAAEQELEQKRQQNTQQAPYHVANVLDDITPMFMTRLRSNYTANGAEAWFAYLDGKTYKITVEPEA